MVYFLADFDLVIYFKNTKNSNPRPVCAPPAALKGGGITSVTPSKTPPWTSMHSAKEKGGIEIEHVIPDIISNEHLTLSQRLLDEPLTEHKPPRLLW